MDNSQDTAIDYDALALQVVRDTVSYKRASNDQKTRIITLVRIMVMIVFEAQPKTIEENNWLLSGRCKELFYYIVSEGLYDEGRFVAYQRSIKNRVFALLQVKKKKKHAIISFGDEGAQRTTKDHSDPDARGGWHYLRHD